MDAFIKIYYRKWCRFDIGNGKKTYMWCNNWSSIGPLEKSIRRRDIFHVGFNINDKLADCIDAHNWKWLEWWLNKYSVLQQLAVPVLEEEKIDVLRCLDNNLEKTHFSVRNIWDSIRKEGPMVSWSKLMWFSHCISKHTFLLWLVFRKSLKTKDKMKFWDGATNIANACLFCHQTLETHDHLFFFECSYSKEVWFAIRSLICMEHIPKVWDSICSHLLHKLKSKETWSLISLLFIRASVHSILHERNLRIFSKRIRTPKQLSEGVIQEIRLKLISLSGKN